jgi:hypothetical protein
VLTNAPHSTTPFLETHYNLEAQYPLCLNDPSGHETKKFAQPLPLMDSFIGSEFWRVWMKTVNWALLGTPIQSITFHLFIFHACWYFFIFHFLFNVLFFRLSVLTSKFGGILWVIPPQLGFLYPCYHAFIFYTLGTMCYLSLGVRNDTWSEILYKNFKILNTWSHN